MEPDTVRPEMSLRYIPLVVPLIGLVHVMVTFAIFFGIFGLA
jgi:hypothetical protein